MEGLGGPVVVYAVGSPYAWDVVESLRRAGAEAVCVDNHGAADPDLPGLTATVPPSAPRFVLGLSSARHRARAAAAAAAAGLGRPLTLVDPHAVVAATTELGHGCYLNAGAVVGSKTRLGCQVNLNRSCSIGHHNTLGYAVATGPGCVLSGGVTVGDLAFVGAGATVLPELTIGAGALVGAGAVVTRDVPPGAVVTGNPARVVRVLEIEEEARCPHC